GLDEMVMYAHKVAGAWNQYFVHQDRMGSLHYVSDLNGPLTSVPWSFGPYGEQFIAPLNPTDYPPYFWAGRRYDPETQLYYFRNRYYSPGLGRFVTADRLGVWADLAHFGNPYAYAGNNPLMFLDPYGLQLGAIQDFITGIGDTLTFGLTAKLRESWYGHGEKP